MEPLVKAEHAKHDVKIFARNTIWDDSRKSIRRSGQLFASPPSLQLRLWPVSFGSFGGGVEISVW